MNTPPATATLVTARPTPVKSERRRGVVVLRSATAATPRSESLRVHQLVRHRVLVGGTCVGGVHPDEARATGRARGVVPRAGHELIRARRTGRRVHDVVLTVTLAVLDALQDVAGVSGRRAR